MPFSILRPHSCSGKSLFAPDEIEKLKELLAHVPKGTETKLAKLLENVDSIKDNNIHEKIIIFTEYLNTQDYIVEKLKEKYGNNDVVRIRGGNHQEKIQAAKEFKRSAHFLVSTQAGGEGINLQHCHILINYDMPWNPMKVEQRIGRIHRYKQKDTAQIYNILAKDTIEERIYQRLDEKLYEITQTIGNDDEREAYRENILGIIAEEIDFDKLYKEVLQKGQQVDEITKEKIDAAIEKAKDVYQKLGDFTQDLEQFSLDKYFKTKGNISLKDIENFVVQFVQSEGKNISTDEEGNYEFIIPDTISSYGGQKYKRITFDREKAIEDQSLEFMAVGHHITDSIINKCSGYGYGGRCVRRQISNATYRGESGIQCNFMIEYQVPQTGLEKNKTLRKQFRTLMFDNNFQYRDELKDLGIVGSHKKNFRCGFFGVPTTPLTE
jgi:superfamily II DNA/RNA helicase